ncbi:hypothetical protein DDZ13_00710 [Coraliomargarita sinensis]|uniref:Outer membrane lipoprotein-sorting protein n=1 Tax=Coraliomargarita sinensis TaxID=2174842 RepID=A0A317ZPU0_9BACT|nr:hypothetical protein [Coraliomargarita sinensis]PXA05421.1 hypothetical protein DDZ13_00710 [Coraliomargarita sinensis]
MFRIHHLLVFSVAPLLLAAADDNTLSLPPEEMNVVVRNTAMPEMGDSRIGKILGRYYRDGLGGPEVWEKIVSLKVSGELKTKDGELQLNAYQKKPDLIKMNLYKETVQTGLTLAYDGEVAWKQKGKRSKPESMTDVEARRFIHSARFGNYLLYPFAEGKRIRFVDTVPVEGAICHQIRVELDTGYQVDYFIDIRSYLEVKVVNKDLLTDAQNSVIYKDYIREFGMPIAKRVESLEEGKWVSSLTLNDVKVNSGVMPWMFHKPD